MKVPFSLVRPVSTRGSVRIVAGRSGGVNHWLLALLPFSATGNIGPRMDAEHETPGESGTGAGRWPIWPLGMLLLFVWHGWMIWTLFDGTGLFDDRPIASGFHPQNIYLGSLGARAISETGHSCCFDPSFQIGYPKTPIFNGSRWAEIFLLCAGSTYNPQAYKLGLAILCAMVPVLVLISCRGVDLTWPATTLAMLFGCLLWWGPNSRSALEAGANEMFLASLAFLAHLGLLAKFHREPSVRIWLGLILTGAAGWYSQPMFIPIALPIVLLYYLQVGAKHAALTWHAGLFAAEILTLALNAHWIVDWVNYWWMRSSGPVSETILRHRTLRTLWDAPLWGGTDQRAFALFLLVSAFCGLLAMERRQRPIARLFALGAFGLYLLALLGVTWEPLGQLGTAGLFVPALWFASVPAAFFWCTLLGWLIRRSETPARVSWGLAALGGLTVMAFHEEVTPYVERIAGAKPFILGLGNEREALMAVLREKTRPDARILWEDRTFGKESPRWTPLLPLLTQRAFIGGLDPDGTIEHSSIGLMNQGLEGRPIGSWSDPSLDDYCKRYNIGWIVAWSASVQKRLYDWPGAKRIATLTDDGVGALFEVVGHVPSFALKGHADLVQADSHHLTLTNVQPADGVVVLSLHYQAGMRVSPSRVQIDREQCAKDPIGYVRLRVASPVPCVTLTWGDR